MEEAETLAQARKTTSILVGAASEKWKAAPMHIKSMAGAYVGPLLAAILAIDDELKKVNDAKK